MEKCILTNKSMPDDKLALTGEGYVSIYLWGRKEIRTDPGGLALLPVDLLARFRAVLGRDPDPDVLEDKGRCLQQKDAND